MTSQPILTLNSSYTGPMVIADNLRKMKTNSGLNRMLSTHNKRFFVLDLTHMTFYYLPDRTAHFSNSTNIPLDSITRIKVTKQAQGLEEDKVWKYEFVVVTKKKMFELITDSKTTMDKFLFAFSNIINIRTKLPLFNWDHYTGESQSPSSSPSNLLLHTQAVEGFNRQHTESLSASPESSPSKQSERSEEPYQNLEAGDLITRQPQQTDEISPAIARIKEAIKIKAIVNDNKDSDSQCDDQKENKQHGLNGLKKRNASVIIRRKASGSVTARGKGFEMAGENQESEASPSTGMDASPFSEMTPVTDSPTGFRGFDVREVLAEPQKEEKLQINIKLNFQKVEDEPVENKKAESYQELTRKATPGDVSARRRPNHDLTLARNHKSFSLKSMVPRVDRVEERGFVGLNEADLSHHIKKATLRNGQNYEELQRAKMSGVVPGKIRLGTGMSMSYARSQVVGQNLDSSPFGQESKKFSLLREVDMSDSPLKKENITDNKKSHPVNDDDWDNEMFGYGKEQISPLKPNVQEINQRQSSGSKYSFNEKKPHKQLSHKRMEFVSSRQGTHNDWDDDL